MGIPIPVTTSSLDTSSLKTPDTVCSSVHLAAWEVFKTVHIHIANENGTDWSDYPSALR